MIKAIIFDCFGVLSTEGFRVFCSKYFKDQPEKRALAQSYMDLHTQGTQSYESFCDSLSKLAGQKTEVVEDYLHSNKPNESLFDYIREALKPKYKIGMLSNAGDDWLSELFLPEDLALLDDVVLSFKFGITKPNQAIYELAAQRLEVGPKECVFVDDIARYCDGARAIGMQAILYEDFEQMKTELQKLLNQSA